MKTVQQKRKIFSQTKKINLLKIKIDKKFDEAYELIQQFDKLVEEQKRQLNELEVTTESS